MKKSMMLIIVCLMSMCIQAQTEHLKFMGIPLTGSITAFQEKLKAKGIEYDAEALPMIFGGVAISMVIVFFFLLFNFRKYGITIICMAAMGLMIPGTLIGLALMNRALGLPSIMGVITLIGMIMRNEILIFEHANDLLKGKDPKVMGRDAYNDAVRQAAYDAGKRRMVPIFLTTATTAVGVVPMIIAQSSFWMPVGVTIFAGGIGALILVVTMLPVTYWKVSTK